MHSVTAIFAIVGSAECCASLGSEMTASRSHAAPTAASPSPTVGAARCDRTDIVFVVDSSGSIQRFNWPVILNFIRRIVNDFTIGPRNVQIGVTLFGDTVVPQFQLNTYRSGGAAGTPASHSLTPTVPSCQCIRTSHSPKLLQHELSCKILLLVQHLSLRSAFRCRLRNVVLSAEKPTPSSSTEICNLGALPRSILFSQYSHLSGLQMKRSQHSKNHSVFLLSIAATSSRS